MLSGNSAGFGNKPRALMCYICGREYGTASLQIHLKTCMKKWETEEGKKPRKDRRPMPQPPRQLVEVLNKINTGGNVNFAELDSYNTKANDEYNDSALIRCDYCNRTFLPERLDIHRKICSPDKPFKPLPPPNAGARSNPPSSSTSASTNKSLGGPSGGYGGGRGGGNASYGYEEQPKSSAVNRGGAIGKKPGVQAPPSRGQYQNYDDDDDDDEYGGGYQPPKSSQQTRAQPAAKGSGQIRKQGYGGGYSNVGGEYQDVQLEECNMCGRRFAADRIDRHQKACTRAQKGEAKHAKKVALAEKKQAEVDRFIAKEAKYKKSNWRQQHEEFVNNLKYNRKLKAVEDRGGDIRSLGPPPKSSAIESNMVECPFCYRKFNPQSAEKHINICRNVINKPKAVPGKGAPLRTSTSGLGAGVSKPMPSKAPATKMAGTTSYGGGSYGNYGGYDDDYQQPSYNSNNYSTGSRMEPTRQSYGGGAAKPPAQKGGGFSTQYGSQGAGRSTQYGASSQGMNTSSKGGGFGVKQGPTLGSLGNAARMGSQQQGYGQTGGASKASKSGYRY